MAASSLVATATTSEKGVADGMVSRERTVEQVSMTESLMLFRTTQVSW